MATINGTSLNDILFGTINTDLLYGLAGNDILVGSVGNDTLNGGAGFDTADYSRLGGPITLLSQGIVSKGALGQDQIIGMEQIIGAVGFRNVIDGTVQGAQPTSFYVDLSVVNPILVINNVPVIGVINFNIFNFVDVIGTTNSDTLIGDGQANLLSGGAGNDLIIGGDGADTLNGGAGNDILYFDAFDKVAGGAGRDFGYLVNDHAVNIDMGATSIEWFRSGFGSDVINAASQTTGVEVYASGGNDLLSGGSGNDFLWGQDGRDTITGGIGNDALVGGLGSDRLTGGSGTDELYGKSGGGGDGAVDTFVFTSNWGTDFVFDFERGTDKLDLSALGTNFAALSLSNTAEGHCYITYGVNLIAVANLGGLITSSDFIF